MQKAQASVAVNTTSAELCWQHHLCVSRAVENYLHISAISLSSSVAALELQQQDLIALRFTPRCRVLQESTPGSDQAQLLLDKLNSWLDSTGRNGPLLEMLHRTTGCSLQGKHLLYKSCS